MQKYCAICNQKIGIGSGSLYETEGNLRNVRICDRCTMWLGSVNKNDMESLAEAREYFDKVLNTDDEELIADLNKKVPRPNDVQQEKRMALETEQHKQAYAKSFNDFYEYDVVTIINENHGQVDREKMMTILAEHASKGWKLHTIYSNELGKNALHVLGFGVNATACEDVLIFERRICGE